MGILDGMAVFVYNIARGNVSVIYQSDLVPAKSTQSRTTKPGQPVNLEIKRGATRVLRPECEPLDGAESSTCILTEGAPIPPSISFDAAGKMVIVNSSNAPTALPQGEATPLPVVQIPTMDNFVFNKARKK